MCSPSTPFCAPRWTPACAGGCRYAVRPRHGGRCVWRWMQRRWSRALGRTSCRRIPVTFSEDRSCSSVKHARPRRTVCLACCLRLQRCRYKSMHAHVHTRMPCLHVMHVCIGTLQFDCGHTTHCDTIPMLACIPIHVLISMHVYTPMHVLISMHVCITNRYLHQFHRYVILFSV